ncbi:ABC transporter ATP-binding protein [uncultured Ruminococcus sp.]|uniref:ABC transporter ATP-binding protein n=1 Tax=uncultured Ruminococcus sp. TaxID=165186 RepID=UPI002620B1BE|nr:ABC transporter ATP-binding protein [uncultured Ruminococcus sp.]
MLQLEQITWNLPDGTSLIQGIDLTIPDEKMVVITGPNGGGKTTLAKLIAGIIPPTSGRILLNGEDITNCSVTERARKGISYAFQQPVRFKGMTVQDMMELAGGESMSPETMCTLLGKVGLCAEEYADREINTGLSGGEMKRIEIASVLAHGGRFIIFDEPEAGIDLWSFTRLVDTFREMQKQEQTLLIISHQERILSIADEIVVVANGKVRTKGCREEILPTLLEDERTARCPLGKEERR